MADQEPEVKAPTPGTKNHGGPNLIGAPKYEVYCSEVVKDVQIVLPNGEAAKKDDNNVNKKNNSKKHL